MQGIERIKLIIGLILITFVVFGFVCYFLMGFDILSGDKYHFLYVSWTRGVDGGASFVPLFFGLCSIGGCYLIANVQGKKNS